MAWSAILTVIIVKVVSYGNRISTHLYNDEHDVEKLLAGIKELS